MDTLAFCYILPTTGRIRDFNPLETCAARRTTKATRLLDGAVGRMAWCVKPFIFYSYCFIPVALKRFPRNAKVLPHPLSVYFLMKQTALFSQLAIVIAGFRKEHV